MWAEAKEMNKELEDKLAKYLRIPNAPSHIDFSGSYGTEINSSFITERRRIKQDVWTWK